MDNARRWPAQARFFYGWIIVAAAFAIAAVASGVTYAFPVFFAPLSRTFGRNRAEISLVFSICIFIWFSMGLFAGILADRFGPRIVALTGCIFMASGLAVAASSSSIYALYGAYGAGVGVGGGLMYIPAISIVQRWFKRKRALASGLAICGTGFGALVFPPIALALTDLAGWRFTHLVFCACVVVVCGGASLALIADPGDIGQEPDGLGALPQSGTGSAASGLTLRDAVATRSFWQLYLASLLSSAAVYVTYVHLVPYSRDQGVSLDASVALISVLGASSVCGRFVLGGIADRIGRRRALSCMFAGLSLTMTWWLLAPATSTTLLIYAVAFGALNGGYISVLPALTMELFGGRWIGSVIGALYTSWGIGGLCGPTFAGAIFDLRHSYFYAILAGAAAMGCAAISCSSIRTPEISY